VANAYFLGCSFTSAGETDDHEILGISFEECNKLKENTNTKDLTEMMVHKLIREKNMDPFAAYSYTRFSCKKNSWAITLSELLNVNCINLAESGGSMQECVFNLKLVEEKLTKDDYVFLGLPPIARLFFLSEDLTIPDRIMLANPHGNERWDTLISFYPDIQLDKEYFNAIDDIIRICRCKGVKLFILPAYTEIHSVSEKLAKEKIKWQHSEFFLKLLDFFSEIENKISEYYIDIPLIKFQYDFLPLCGYNHPNIEAHRVYGIEVYKHLKENKYV
jgi:hypothetical protein